jgi:hypothetical protein
MHVAGPRSGIFTRPRLNRAIAGIKEQVTCQLGRKSVPDKKTDVCLKSQLLSEPECVVVGIVHAKHAHPDPIVDDLEIAGRTAAGANFCV